MKKNLNNLISLFFLKMNSISFVKDLKIKKKVTPIFA